MTTVFYHRIQALENPGKGTRASLGGQPIMHPSQPWPVCKMCGEKMLFYFQCDILPKFQTPFVPGSHLLVFACRKHDDIAELYRQSNEVCTLPPAYWEKTEGHYQVILNRPFEKEVVHPSDPRLVPQSLSFTKENEQLTKILNRFDIGTGCPKIGGVPCWLQDPEKYRCCCGAPMRYFCQLPEYYEFPKTSEAPEQSNGISKKFYILFLGNAVYFLACEAQCSPNAVMVVMQN